MTTLKRYNQTTGEWEYVLSGPKGDTGATGIKGDKGDPGGFTTSSSYTGDLNALTTAGLYNTASGLANAPMAGSGGHIEVTRYNTYVRQHWQARDGRRRWISEPWATRAKHLFLIPGDSPVGFRLPLASLPPITEVDYPYVIPADPFAERGALPEPSARRAEKDYIS